MSDKSVKVTDRRMFTLDGELRAEYRDLELKSASGSAEPGPSASRPAAPPPAAAPARPPADQPPADQPLGSEPPGGAPGAPGFFDLVGLLAEPATIYLREAHSTDPQTAAQSLELARLHIDLLSVLRAKTEGNLSPSEKAMLEDVIYQLRSGFVGLRG